jgi:hypothetical protein
MANLTFPNDHNAKKYSAGNITVGYFVPSSSCKYLSFIDAINIINMQLQNKSILFIGDSLGGHQYTCLSCEMEFISRRFHMPFYTNIKYHYDVTLRPDEPCHPSCIHNNTFLKYYQNKFPSPCIACPDGKKAELDVNHPYHWKWAVDINDTGVIIMNGGAWYSPVFGFGASIQGTKKYKETLLHIIPIIRSYINSGIIVIWFVLPPAQPLLKEYGWDEFVHRNEIAKGLLEPEKVLIYNPNNATYLRYISDPSASFDLLHWRGPGITSIPNYISRTLLHMLARHLLSLK